MSKGSIDVNNLPTDTHITFVGDDDDDDDGEPVCDLRVSMTPCDRICNLSIQQPRLPHLVRVFRSRTGKRSKSFLV